MPRKFPTTTTSSRSLWVSSPASWSLDLEKVQRKLNEGAYRTREQFKYDVTKIFDNARIYNQEETIYYKYANQLQNHVRPMMDRLKEGSLLTPEAVQAEAKRRNIQEPEEEEGSSKKLRKARGK